jgi:hypothetical protein
MIDDKKIEAAKEEIYEDRFLLNGEDVIFDNDAKEEMYYKEDIKEAIGLGAKWMREEFLKDLLHDAEEEPKKGCVFLYKTIFGGYGINQIINGDEWKYIIKYQRATQWLYIDDLLPKKGDKHD